MSSKLINQVIELTNIERTNAGLQPLTLNSQLANAAQDHSGDMANDDFFSHTGVDGSNVASRVKDSGYQYSTVGENIAAGQKTAEQVVEGWMNSPGHRANILNANFTEIGIGYVYLKNDTGSVNYNHYWTQVFGTSLNSNQGSNPEPKVTENSAPETLENIVDAEDINQQPNLEVVKETSKATPEIEVDNSEQSEAVEDINNSSEPDNSTPEVEFELEVVEETSKATPEIEVENSEQSETVEDINNSSELDNSTPEVKSELEVEVVKETSKATPEIEVENSGQSEAVEDVNNDSLEPDELIKFKTQYNNDDLISESYSVALAGESDANSFGDSHESEINLQFIENSESNLFEIMGNSYMGMTMDTRNYFDSMDIIEYSSDSSWAEIKQSVVQEVFESFL